jgi:hypothetical protein
MIDRIDDTKLAEISRKLRARADAILGVVWFMPEATSGFTELGLSTAASTLGSRAACMGRVSGEVAAAAFGAINPAAVIPAIEEAWTKTDPDTLLAARLDAATRHLAAIIGEQPAGVERAVELLRRAVEAARFVGHPVYAGLRSLDWPGFPVGDLWRACDMVREHRGDSHVNAWNAAGFDPVEINVLSERWRGLPAGSITTGQMAWSRADEAAAVDRLRARGLLDDDGLTGEGTSAREAIETATDAQERELVEALGRDVDELFALLLPWARAVNAENPWTPG